MKALGIFFIVAGLIFLFIGIVKCITTFNETDRIYTTATIVNIEKYETGDSEQPTGYRTYVEFEIAGEKTVRELNTHKTSFKIGKEIEIYYFDHDIEMAYEKGSEILLIFFPIVGAIAALLGALLAFNKKLQNFLLKIPCSE